jgi:hypothetical protein
MDKQDIKSKTNYVQVLRKKFINTEKQRNKQTRSKRMKMRRSNKNTITKNYIREKLDYEQMLINI